MITDMIAPTSKRMQDTRAQITQQNNVLHSIDEFTTELSANMNDLQGDKSESFRYKVMEDMQTKYMHLKIDSEKRETVLLNSISLFQEKIDNLKSRITDVQIMFKNFDESLEIRFNKIKADNRKDLSYQSKQIEMVRETTMENKN